MTTVAAQSNLVINRSQTVDMINSLLVMRVYYRNQWIDTTGHSTNSMTYYMKYLTEPHYDGYNTEFTKAITLLSDIVSSENMFKTAILYLNLNRARTIRNVENMQIAKFVHRPGKIDLEIDRQNPRITDDVFDFLLENNAELNKLLR
jgi:hypothetical protein